MRKIDTSKAHYVGLDQRIAPRSDVYCRLPFVLPDGRQEMCTCVNISADGLLMRYERGLEPGDLVVFRMPIIGRTAAKVVWSLGGKTGVQFEKSITAEDYLPMIRAMGARLANKFASLAAPPASGRGEITHCAAAAPPHHARTDTGKAAPLRRARLPSRRRVRRTAAHRHAPPATGGRAARASPADSRRRPTA